MLKKSDALFVCLPLIAAVVLLFVFTGGSGHMLVIQSGSQTQEIDLLSLDESETRVIEVEGAIGVSVIEVTRSGARFISSPCNGHICTKTGYISQAGQTVVCLPNKVIIRITGAEVDGATG